MQYNSWYSPISLGKRFPGVFRISWRLKCFWPTEVHRSANLTYTLSMLSFDNLLKNKFPVL